MLLRKPTPPPRGPRQLQQEQPVEEILESTDSAMEAGSGQEDWVETWEQLPTGGEYLPTGADGVVWYRTPDGSHWKQEEDQSWRLWQE